MEQWNVNALHQNITGLTTPPFHRFCRLRLIITRLCRTASISSPVHISQRFRLQNQNEVICGMLTRQCPHCPRKGRLTRVHGVGRTRQAGYSRGNSKMKHGVFRATAGSCPIRHPPSPDLQVLATAYFNSFCVRAGFCFKMVFINVTISEATEVQKKQRFDVSTTCLQLPGAL